MGLGLLVLILLPVTIWGARNGRNGSRTSQLKRRSETELQQDKLKQMDRALRETSERLARLSADLRREMGTC